MRRSALHTLVGIVCCTLVGCVGTSRTALRAPDDVPGYTIDVAASEVSVQGATDAESIREVGAAALSSMALGRAGAAPARFRAVVHAEVGVNGAAHLYCTLPLLPLAIFVVPFLACPTSTYEAHVELRLETARGVFGGSGRASHSLGYKPSRQSWAATVHNAFQDALANATLAEEESAADVTATASSRQSKPTLPLRTGSDGS